ncbi:tetratricopeptide repeat protein [Actinoallomurus sp. CA-142502]|uniref:tetratricopeptide repeat protein n=1 Tax=Actinoallomurus sp. CA-142502 TaxID=3239885 RepID=UPI003D8FDE41
MVRREKVAETFARRADGTWEFGSGYLIAPRLVLTAAHAVVVDGAPAPTVMVRFLGDPSTPTGRVAWWRHDDTVDAALVEVTGPAEHVPEAATVRWGRLTGTRGGVRCEATGFPDAQRGPDDIRDTEHLSGTINPGTGAKARRYDVLVDAWPDSRTRSSAWAGISGAALFCGEDALLTGVLVADPPEFGSRRLTAVPVARFLDDPGFVALVGEQTTESVELAPLFEPPTVVGGSRSPAYLLAADAEVVPFHGRTELLAKLSAWCEEPDTVSTWLVTGPGGQGKTRLAREFAARRRAAGWAVGWLRPDNGDPLDVGPLAASAVPVLVIVDYAETRTDQIRRLATRIGAVRDSGLRVRLLLLARHAGEWWRQLVIGSSVIERALGRHVTELPPLEDTAERRAPLFATAVEHFARALRRRGDQIGPDLPDPPDDLGHPRYGSVLTVHMTALASLLQLGFEPVPEKKGEGVEDVLLGHEERYWGWTAYARGLRFAYSKALRRAVATATLFSATTETEAAHLLGGVPGLRDQPEERLLALAEWLHDLYPAADSRYWGRLQPDRLGEYLVARVTAEDTDLFDGLFGHVPARDTQYGFEVLSRAAALRPAAADTIARLVSSRPELASVAAVAATRSDQPDPLITAIEPLTAQVTAEPDWLDELIAVTWAAPSLFGRWSIEAFRRLVDRYRELARDDPATHRPRLASQLFALAERLNSVGETKEAQESLEEAVSLGRELPDDAETGLAPALGLLANLYMSHGQTRKALATAKESVEQWERKNPPDLHGTVQALSNLSAILNESGDREGSLRTAEHALEVYHQVAEPDPWLTIIATSAGTNRANRLIDFGVQTVGLAIHREVVDTRRRIVEDHPTLFDHDLASGLHNLAKTLHRMGEDEEAAQHIEEAVSIYRPLAERLPAVYLRNLADTLGTEGVILLGRPGKARAAVESLAESERIATAIDDKVLMFAATGGLELARRRSPELRKYVAELRRYRSRSDPPGHGQKSRPDPARVVRNQPKRRSRRDRKKE